MASTLADINSQIQKHDEQIAQLRKQAEELRNQERAGVIEDIRRKIADYGLTASDLKLSAGRAVPPSAPPARRRPRPPPSTAARPAKPGPAAVAASRAG